MLCKRPLWETFCPLMSRDALTAHFDGVIAGGVVDVSIARSKGGGMKRTAVVTFATSADAQSATLRGNTFNGQQLTMDIYQPSGARAVAPTSIRESKGASFGPRVSTDGVDQDHAGSTEWRNPARLPANPSELAQYYNAYWYPLEMTLTLTHF
jgi:hypothetical protein